MFVEALSMKLPHLEELCLDFRDPETTINALLTLGPRCPKLRLCCLPPSLRQIKHLPGADSICFPSLKSLWAKPQTDNIHDETTPDPSERILKKNMPKLVERNIQRGPVRSSPFFAKP